MLILLRHSGTNDRKLYTCSAQILFLNVFHLGLVKPADVKTDDKGSTAETWVGSTDSIAGLEGW